MTQTTDPIAEFLLARIAETKAAAQAAAEASPPPWRSSTLYDNLPDDDPDAFTPIEWSVDCKPSKLNPDVTVQIGEEGWLLPSTWDEAGTWNTVAEVDYDRSAQFDHIARHDPARVLADCEAKRRIVGQYQQLVGAMPPELMEVTPLGHSLRETLRLLALPFADHPDYRPEWAL